MKIDDDQDSIWISVEVAGEGASCHVGYKSCFYRTVPLKIKVDSFLRQVLNLFCLNLIFLQLINALLFFHWGDTSYDGSKSTNNTSLRMNARQIADRYPYIINTIKVLLYNNNNEYLLVVLYIYC